MINNYRRKRQVRDFSLYVIEFTDGSYYVGTTGQKNYMRRINQHGGLSGAWINRGKTRKRIVEIQHLGIMMRSEAENIENDVTLQYRKKYGEARVRGGYHISKTNSVMPAYTPGSWQSIVFVGVFLVVALLTFFYSSNLLVPIWVYATNPGH